MWIRNSQESQSHYTIKSSVRSVPQSIYSSDKKTKNSVFRKKRYSEGCMSYDQAAVKSSTATHSQTPIKKPRHVPNFTIDLTMYPPLMSDQYKSAAEAARRQISSAYTLNRQMLFR